MEDDSGEKTGLIAEVVKQSSELAGSIRAMPRVSVVMAVYNEEKYVKDAVESILSQTFTDFEFVIIEDGSNDGTLGILQGYEDKQIRLFHQENAGLEESLNKGIRLARGEYIARMDADDLCLPERLQKQVDSLDAHPNVGMIGSACRIVDESSGVVRSLRLPTSNQEIRRYFLRENPFVHSSVMIRRAALDKVGLYDPRFLWGDYALWVRVASQFEVANLAEELIIRRERTTSSYKRIPKSRIFREKLRVQWMAFRSLPFWIGAPFHLGRSFLAMVMHMLSETAQTVARI